MRKILTILMLLALTVPAWAGEKTITISRNEGEYEVSNGVYTITKGGVQLVMTGGMNNPNYLLMKQQTTMTFLSNKYKIKKIIFHCMDNTVESNLDCFFWGPTTMSVQYSQTHSEYAGRFIAPFSGNSYDGCWTSNIPSGTYTDSDGRLHKSYSDGLPTSYELMFTNKGKPVRFSSIDIVVDKEMGDIFDLVTSNDDILDGKQYVFVNWYASKALSVNTKQGRTGNNQVHTGCDVSFITGIINNESNEHAKVKVNDEAQILKLEKVNLPLTNDQGMTINTNRPWLINDGGNYLRIQTNIYTGIIGDVGYDLTSESLNQDYSYARISVNSSDYGVGFYFRNPASSGYTGTTLTDYKIGFNRTNNYFRVLESESYEGKENQRIRLYKPAENYRVLTGCTPAENNPGYITLGDGVLEIDGVDYSQSAETVTFFVGNQNSYQIESINVYTVTLDGDGNITGRTLLYSELTPNSTTSTGANYSFTMPASHVYIEANFALPTYYDITTICTPAEGGAITMTGGVSEYNNIIEAIAESTVTFTVDTNEGYTFDNVTITNSNGNTVSYTFDETTGTYTFTMPEGAVSITANFRAKLMISTACEPSNGGYFEQNTMTCNGQSTNFYNGSQYYADDVMTFMVKTNYGYRINKVIVTDDYGMETTLTPTATYDDGNFYSFSMPNSNVTITAYFYQSVLDLYLLGEANGGSWAPNQGVKFNYDADNEIYYVNVYFKGNGNFGDQSGSKYNTFNLTKKISELSGDAGWNDIAGDRLGYTTWVEGGQLIEDGETKDLGGAECKENSFKIEAGIYTITVNKNMTTVSVSKIPVALIFDPAGGTVENPEIVSKGALVTLNGDLYNKIKAINPDESDANFMYKATKTVDGNATNETENATTATSNISVLDVVNEGETVTQLEGWNYLGWIVASNTGYYKVISTPLHWIEEFGEKDKTYTVSDRLQGVYAQGGHLWCKDLGDISIVKTKPNTDQIDYLAKTLKTAGHIFADNMRIGNWDQSNWVELDFSGLGQEAGNAAATALVNKYIKAGTITGVYSDDINYTIKVSSTPEADGDATYVPNTYCTSNFIEENLKIGNNVGPTVNGTTYYFLNPKIQEYAIITFAMWDVDKQIMVVPGTEPFNGAACIGRWDLNEYKSQLEALNVAANGSTTCYNQYEFHIIVQRENKNYGSPINASKAYTPLKPDQTASAVIRTQPLDLQVNNPLTAITRVGTEAQVVGVEYVNIAGMRSSKPWQGINIVVTRYSDGSTTTTKVVK